MAPNDDPNEAGPNLPTTPSGPPDTGAPPESAAVAPQVNVTPIESTTTGVVDATTVGAVQATTAGAAERFDGLSFQDVNALLAVIKAQAQAKK